MNIFFFHFCMHKRIHVALLCHQYQSFISFIHWILHTYATHSVPTIHTQITISIDKIYFIEALESNHCQKLNIDPCSIRLPTSHLKIADKKKRSFCNWIFRVNFVTQIHLRWRPVRILTHAICLQVIHNVTSLTGFTYIVIKAEPAFSFWVTFSVQPFETFMEATVSYNKTSDIYFFFLSLSHTSAAAIFPFLVGILIKNEWTKRKNTFQDHTT